MARESVAKSFYTVLILAFVCSLLVAGAAVGLRPLQEANKRLDRQKNILRAAGLYQNDVPVARQFAALIETRVVELATGRIVPAGQIPPEEFDQLKSAWDQNMGQPLAKDEDLAGLRRLEKYSLVYFVKENGKVTQIILPIRGKGLWSTMYGYVALDRDLNTIRGITFYEHGETPGLGGEIENPHWQAGWQGKKIYDPAGQVALEVVKGKAATRGAAAAYQVDGLSGATLTANGVTDLLHFWFGEHGFAPFIDRLKAKGGIDV